MVVCSDGYDTINQTFTLKISNTAPYIYEPFYEDDYIFEVHVNDELEYVLSESSIMESDEDDTISYELISSDGGSTLPDWIVFNADMRRFNIEPSYLELVTNCPKDSFFLIDNSGSVANELGVT